MYNLAIRRCTSPPLLARGWKFSNENLLPCRGSNPGPAEPEADMLPSEPARQDLCVVLKTNVATINSSHATGPGSIHGRINFLVEVFPGFSLNRKTNVREFRLHSSPVIIWTSSSKPYIIYLRTATVSDHSCSTWPSLNNKQQHKLNHLKEVLVIALYNTISVPSNVTNTIS